MEYAKMALYKYSSFYAATPLFPSAKLRTGAHYEPIAAVGVIRTVSGFRSFLVFTTRRTETRVRRQTRSQSAVINREIDHDRPTDGQTDRIMCSMDARAGCLEETVCRTAGGDQSRRT